MNKDKGKRKLLDEEEELRSANVIGEELETEHVRVVTPADYEDYEDEEIYSWDWRHFPVVLGPVVDQRSQATCWAVTVVRAVQALLNIGVGIQLVAGRELSIQHIVNLVKYDSDLGINTALNLMKNSGVSKESQCHHRGEIKKRKCSHKVDVNRYTVDSLTPYTEGIEDVDLE